MSNLLNHEKKNSNETKKPCCAFWPTDKKKQNFFILGLIILVGTTLRLFGLDERSLWVDEMFSIAHALGNQINLTALQQLGQSMDPETPQSIGYYQDFLLKSHGIANWTATVDVLKLNNHPPLYFWLINLVIHTLGDSPAMLRLPAFLCGVACIPMTFLLGRKIHSTPLGLISALILALSGYQILHAQDARPYTMVTLLAISQCWLLLRIMAFPADIASKEHEDSINFNAVGHWISFALLGTLGLYTHYFYGPFLLFLFAYGLILKSKDIQFMVNFIISFVLIALAFSPWLEILKVQKEWLAQSSHFTAGRWDLIQVPEYIWRMLNEFVSPKNGFMKIIPAILFVYSLYIYYYRKNKWLAISPVVLMSLLWIFAIYGFQIALDYFSDTSTLNVRRYTLLAAPAYYLLLGTAIVNIKVREQWVQKALIGGLVLIMGFNAMQVVKRSIPFAQHFNEAAQWITTEIEATRSRSTNNSILVNPSGPHTVAMAYYLDTNTNATLLGLPVRSMFTETDYKKLNTRLDNASQTSNQLWLVLSQSSDSAKLAIHQRLTSHHFKKTKTAKFPKSIEVVLYARSN